MVEIQEAMELSGWLKAEMTHGAFMASISYKGSKSENRTCCAPNREMGDKKRVKVMES